MIDSGFMGMVFNNFQLSPDLWVWFFCKIAFIGEHFQSLRIYGYDFQKIFRIYGYTFQKLVPIYGWYFYDLNCTTPYLENSSNPPPPPPGALIVILGTKSEQCRCDS